MPEVYYKIRRLMESPSARIEDYERIVDSDPMLAIRIMRIANSEFFGFNRKADDLYDAISLIGIIQLHDLLLSSLCMRAFYNIPEEIFNFNNFWRNGIERGIAARSIARLCRLPANNRYFTLGLILEIGHAVMYINKPGLAFKALLESQRVGCGIDEIEREYFGFDYCQLGSALVKQWQLPDVFSQIIACHLYPELSSPLFKTETEIVYLAHLFCEAPHQFKHYFLRAQISQQRMVTIQDNIEELITNEIAKNTDQVFAMLSPPATSGMAVSAVEM